MNEPRPSIPSPSPSSSPPPPHPPPPSSSLPSPSSTILPSPTEAKGEVEGGERSLLSAKGFMKGLESVLATNFSAISTNIEENRLNFEMVQQHIEKHKEMIENVGEKLTCLEKVVERVKVTEIEHLLAQLESKLTNKFNDSFETLSTSNITSFSTQIDDLSFKMSLISDRMDQTSSRLSLLTNKINEILAYLMEKESEEENDINDDFFIPRLPSSLLPALPEVEKKAGGNEKLITKMNIGGRRRRRLTEDRLEEILLAKLEMLKREIKRELLQKMEIMEEGVHKKMEDVEKKISEEGEKQKEVNKEIQGWKRSSLQVTQNARDKLETLEDGWKRFREGIEERWKKAEGRVNEVEEACYKKEETDKRIEKIKRDVEEIEERVRQMLDGYGKGGGDAGIFTKIKWNCASCDKQVDSLGGNLTDFKNWAIFPPKETFPARLIGKMGSPRKKISVFMEKTSLPVLSFDGGIRTMGDSFKEKNTKLKPMKF